MKKTKTNIKVISASAGSGKTYRLTEELARRLHKKQAEPEAVIAVTFTKSAAEELKGRVRSRLFEEGMPEEAQRMEGALVGTVHSVCESLLKRFAFEAGLSPRVEVLPEDQAGAFFEQAIAQALTPGILAELTPALERFQMREPLKPVKALAELARLNRIPAAALPAMARDSVRRFHGSVLPAPEWFTADAADDCLRAALRKAIPAMEALVDDAAAKNSRDYLRAVQAVLAKLETDTLPWSRRADLCGNPGKLLKDLAEPLQDIGKRSPGHPLLREDAEVIIRHLFALAGEALRRYEEWKRSRALIDFTDMEALALDLLGDPQVQAALKGDFRLLFVDEFQDTSPLQLALFSRLGGIVDEVVWVGDKKQAIFGFRDSDPVLMDAAYAEAAKTAKPDLLDTSYRSRPELVEFCNALFVPLFGALGARREEVALKPHRKKPAEKLPPAVECWVMGSRNQEGDDLCLVQGIQALLDPAVPVRIVDPVEDKSRPIRPGDIAVLRRKNKGCKSLAAALGNAGVQAALAQTGLNATLEATYLLAAVEVVLDRRAALPALTLLLFQDPADPEKLINERLRLVKRYKAGDTWENPWPASALLNRLRDLEEDQKVLSPSQMVDRIITAGGLEDLCLRWGSGELRLGNVDRLRACARQYEQECLLTGSGASLLGLHAWLGSLDEGGEQAAWASEYAVQISTYHKAKGREWPVVILGDLHNGGKARVHAAAPAAESHGKGFDLSAPLENRGLRYWPWPYKGSSTGAPLWGAITATREEQEAAKRSLEEEARLIYVGFTRARDLLVLPGRASQSVPKALEKVGIALQFPKDAEPGPTVVDFGGGLKAQGLIRHFNGQGVAPGTAPGPLTWFARPTGTPPALAPKFLNASQLPAFSVPASSHPSIPAVIALGDRLSFKGTFTKDEPAFGDAVHAFLAADRPELPKSDRLALARRIQEVHGAGEFLPPEALVEAGNRLIAWIQREHPDAAVHRELPVQLRQGEQIIAGTADLVLEMADGFILLDHKGFPGNEKQCKDKALTFAGQLDAYARALEMALGKKCLARFIHFPVQGLLVELA